MKRSRHFSQTPVRLPVSVHHQLSAYALAIGAAGAAIAAVPPAEAKIIYTPTHHTLTNGTLGIPVAGSHDFKLSDTFHISTGSWSTQLLDINVTARASVVASKGSAAALKKGAVIGSADKFQTGKVLMAGGFCETQISSSQVFGPFANTTQRYLGLKFKLNGKVHYGWARFSSVKASACNGGPAVSATLTGYAYETIPNKPIIAGRTKMTDEVTKVEQPAPQPATLWMLAMGAPALSIWWR